MLSSASRVLGRDPGSIHRRALEHSLLGIFPLLVAGLAFYFAFSGGYAAGDFTHSFLVAGWRELHGADPYHWTRDQILRNVSFPYPALVAILLEPFALLPGGMAAGLYLVVCIAAFAAGMYVMGVRDWRIYGVTVLWSPVLIGWQTGNFTLPLVLGLAVLWRYRDRPWLAGFVAAALISIKPILFPVGVWVIATERYRAAVSGAAFGVALNALSWTLVGWNEFGRWLHLVSLQSADLYKEGYSLIALVSHLGGSYGLGTAVEIVISLALLAACVRLGRIRQEAAAFVVAIGVCLSASPLIDQHYFALLAVPLAMAFPRLGWPWLVPLMLWLCPATGGAAWQVGLWLLVAAATTVTVTRSLLRPLPQPDDSPSPAAPVAGHFSAQGEKLAVGDGIR